MGDGILNRFKRSQKDGDIGERAAEYFFRRIGWRMTRIQPPTRYVKVRGELMVIQSGKGGVSDYVGYYMYIGVPLHRACEVKATSGDTCPYSRLSERQKKYLESLPDGCAWVLVCWLSHDCECTVHPYPTWEKRGSFRYKKSEKKIAL
jgi:hypothetical protein